jgi:membrane protein
LTFIGLAKRVWSEAGEDDATRHAAELTFYSMLAFFPLLIFLISILGFAPSAQDRLVDHLTKATPKDAAGLLRDWVRDVASKSTGSLLSFSLLSSLWAASSGMAALMRKLNVAYEVYVGVVRRDNRGRAVGDALQPVAPDQRASGRGQGHRSG